MWVDSYILERKWPHTVAKRIQNNWPFTLIISSHHTDDGIAYDAMIFFNSPKSFGEF